MQPIARGEATILLRESPTADQQNRPSASRARAVAIDTDAIVSVASNGCWIASTSVLCHQCLQFCDVTGLVFPVAGSIVVQGERRGRPLSTAAGVEHLWLLYVRQLSVPTSVAIAHFYVDHDLRVSRRYLMNHCDRCHAKFSDFKLFESPEGAFNGRHPMTKGRITCRSVAGLVWASGCVAPVAPHDG